MFLRIVREYGPRNIMDDILNVMSHAHGTMRPILSNNFMNLHETHRIIPGHTTTVKKKKKKEPCSVKRGSLNFHDPSPNYGSINPLCQTT